MISKTHRPVDGSILVGPSQKDEVLRKSDLEGKKKEDSLNALSAFVYIVAQKQIVCVLDVSARLFVWNPKCFKQAV